MTKKNKIKFLQFFIIALNIALIYFWLFFKFDNNLKVSFLDIGQGDAILIQTPFNQNILIDGGPTENKLISELNNQMHLWDKTIDLLILTHPDKDHINGTIAAIKRLDVKNIMYTGVNDPSLFYAEWKKIIKDKNIPTTIVEHPFRITLGKNCFIDIIYPFESLKNKEIKNINDSSIVSKLNCSGKKFLFAGDIEEPDELSLVQAKIDLASDVFKADHHGSDTSNTDIFLNSVKPKIIVIQVGAGNNYGHPSLRVIKRFERLGTKIYRNDLDGIIALEVINGQIIKK